MADLTIAEVVRAGVLETLTAVAAAGDAVSNTGAFKGRVMVTFSNAHATNPRTITIVSQETRDTELSLAVADPTVVLAAGERYAVGPFPTGIYNDTADAKVKFTYSDSGADLYAQAKKLIPAKG